MGQKLDNAETLDKETLLALLLKDGEVYQHSGGDRILSDEDIDTLCDRYVYPWRLIHKIEIACLLTPSLEVMRPSTALLEALEMPPVSKSSKLPRMVLLK